MWAVALAVTVGLLPCALSQDTNSRNQGPPYYTQEPPTVWHVNQYPGDPWWHFQDCNRVNRSAVCDPNSLISTQEANEIDSVIESVTVGTRCPCYNCVNNQRGYIIRVALMEEMADLFNLTGEVMDKLRNAQVFAYLLSKRWKFIGNCNETVLIVYSRVDNVLYTLTGQRASAKLNESLVVEISVDVRPYFTEKQNLAKGIITMIRKYRDVFNMKYKRHSGEDTVDGNNGIGGCSFFTASPILLVVTIATLLYSYLAYPK